MATMLRCCARQGRILTSSLLRGRQTLQPVCFISTSKDKKDVSSTVDPMQQSETFKKDVKHFKDDHPAREKNWITYGYDYVDRDFDRFAHNMTMFFLVTMILCWGTFVIAYQPDHRMRDWSYREAFLEIERRRQAGLPLVDSNYVDPEKMELPEDEELGHFEIIV